MGCLLPEKLIEEVIAFHRHSCPGLAMGIRAAEYAMKLFLRRRRVILSA